MCGIDQRPTNCEAINEDRTFEMMFDALTNKGKCFMSNFASAHNQ